MVITLLLIIHILVGVAMCIFILMQSSKGEGLSGAFGMGQGTTTLFGADTANVLVKITTVLAIIFMCTSLLLAYLKASAGRSVLSKNKAASEESTMTAPPEDQQPSPESMAPDTPSESESGDVAPTEPTSSEMTPAGPGAEPEVEPEQPSDEPPASQE